MPYFNTSYTLHNMLKILICLWVVSGWIACDDETTEEAAYSFHAIESFTVPDVEDASLAVAIYDDTLWVYWPPAVELPETITPTVTVSERAVVSPASGETVLFTEGLAYIVTAEDGTTATYVLHIIVNQQPPALPAATTAKAIDGQAWTIPNFENLIPDVAHTQLWLVTEDETEVALTLTAVTPTQITTEAITEAVVTPGNYKLKVTTGIYTVTSEDNLLTAYLQPTITAFSPQSGEVGDEVVITGTHFSATASENAVYFGTVQAVVTAATTTELHVTVPEGAMNTTITVTVDEVSDTSDDAFAVLTDGTYQTVVSTYAGTGSHGHVDGPALSAALSPYGVAVGANGTVYVLNYSFHAIQEIATDGTVSTLAGSGSSGSADGTGTEASFKNPLGITVDPAGNLFVIDKNHLVRKITTAGVVTTLAGNGAGYADGTGTAAQFNNPHGIVADSEGNLFITDYGNYRIRKVTPDGVVTTLAGTGSAGNTNGTGTVASFGELQGIAIDADDNLYVCNYYGDVHNIRKITPAGVVTTLAGGTKGYADGAAAEAQFSSPVSIVADAAGNVYVGENGNYRVRIITPEGMVYTWCGSGVSGYADGDGNEAMFKRLQGMAMDENGVMYVADFANFLIRKIEL